jgi:hypothetical protein
MPPGLTRVCVEIALLKPNPQLLNIGLLQELAGLRNSSGLLLASRGQRDFKALVKLTAGDMNASPAT